MINSNRTKRVNFLSLNNFKTSFKISSGTKEKLPYGTIKRLMETEEVL
jgi:hypothetical protein